MRAKAVVHHGEMMDTLGQKTMDRQHHVRGIQRMNEVGDDAVGLLPQVDLSCFILLIYKEREIRCHDARGLWFADRMNHMKTGGCCPRHASICFRESGFHVPYI